jgi:hypothetical protein
MAVNRVRKRVKTAAVFPAPLAGILLVVSLLALTYLWLNGRCDTLGLSIKNLERKKAELGRRIVNEEFKWSNMTSPRNMQKLLEAHGLTMTWPSEKNVVRIRRTDSISTDHALLAQQPHAQHTGAMLHD